MSMSSRCRSVSSRAMVLCAASGSLRGGVDVGLSAGLGASSRHGCAPGLCAPSGWLARCFGARSFPAFFLWPPGGSA
eukprot:CAMPEP_0179885322 /NCGR_PEP_ID=MMETSP0982-20121206/30208_1 /TAXON_ID=483367 /ORGANISM="non described non described, Strain CCMP 2436" /LENGTH=76 /DNA_ID=CAMNT_0021780873 /DNA_START=124 /DNA_END=354 /DNA_ORIENTATION=+